jgi:carboxylesterase
MAHPVLPGAEPFAFEGGDVGVLLLHGFTGSPQGLRPWGEALRDAGLAVRCPLLPGHGTHWKDLAATRAEDWTRAAGEALDALSARCSTVVVGALSFGAALALQQAATRPDEVRGVVVVNPFLYVKDRRLVLLPLLKLVVPSFPGVGDDVAAPGERELAYDRIPLKSFASARRLLAAVRRELPRVTQPLLCFVSPQDHVVDPGNTELVARTVGSSDVEVVRLERSYHVATLDYERQTIFDGSLAFARRVAGSG